MKKIGSFFFLLASFWGISCASAQGMPLRCAEEKYTGLSLHYEGESFPKELGEYLGIGYGEEDYTSILQGYVIVSVEEKVLHLKREGLPLIYTQDYFFPEHMSIRLDSEEKHIEIDYSYAGTIHMLCRKLNSN